MAPGARPGSLLGRPRPRPRPAPAPAPARPSFFGVPGGFVLKSGIRAGLKEGAGVQAYRHFQLLRAGFPGPKVSRVATAARSRLVLVVGSGRAEPRIEEMSVAASLPPSLARSQGRRRRGTGREAGGCARG